MSLTPQELLAIRVSTAVADMNAIHRGDPESAHVQADAIVIKFLRETGNGEVADAWTRTEARCGFWYA